MQRRLFFLLAVGLFSPFASAQPTRIPAFASPKPAQLRTFSILVTPQSVKRVMNVYTTVQVPADNKVLPPVQVQGYTLDGLIEQRLGLRLGDVLQGDYVVRLSGGGQTVELPLEQVWNQGAVLAYAPQGRENWPTEWQKAGPLGMVLLWPEGQPHPTIRNLRLITITPARK